MQPMKELTLRAKTYSYIGIFGYVSQHYYKMTSIRTELLFPVTTDEIVCMKKDLDIPGVKRRTIYLLHAQMVPNELASMYGFISKCCSALCS